MIVAVSTMTIALGLTVLVGWIAIPLALNGRAKIWVEPRIRKKCGGDFARIFHVVWQLRGHNHAVLFIVATSIELLAVAVGLLTVYLVSLAGDPKNNRIQSLAPAVALGLPILAILVIAWLLRRIQASRPLECWPPGLIAMERIIPTAYYVAPPQ